MEAAPVFSIKRLYDLQEVDLQIAETESTSGGHATAAYHRLDPGQQLGEGKRLDQVVIRAGIQTADTVGDRVASGQHEHRRFDAALAERFQDIETVPARKTEVEEDEVEPLGNCLVREKTLLAGA